MIATRRKVRGLPLAAIGLAMLEPGLVAVRGEEPAGGAANRLAKERAQLVERQIEQTEHALAELKDRLDPLQERVREMLDLLSAIQLEEEEQTEKPKEKPATTVEFRPPLLHISRKPVVVLIVCENGRAALVDLPAVIAAKKSGIEMDILPKIRQKLKGIWPGTWKTSAGAFDVKYVLDMNNETIRFELARKSADPGETPQQLAREDSVVAGAIRRADASETVVQCAVYPDSFEIFRVVRSLGWTHHMEVGWVPFPSAEPVGIGPGLGVPVN